MNGFCEPREPERIHLERDNVEQGLGKLVLTVIELIRQLVERQAVRRVEGGTLSDEQIEELGVTLSQLDEKIEELKGMFGLENEELNVNLGPLGNLM